MVEDMNENLATKYILIAVLSEGDQQNTCLIEENKGNMLRVLKNVQLLDQNYELNSFSQNFERVMLKETAYI